MTWQQVKAVILLPFTVLIVIPAVILYFPGVGGMALRRPAPWNVLMLIGAAVLVSIGLTLFVATMMLFGKTGKGTLAPWNPPQRLVMAGPYRHVRNPMISGVLFILSAEAPFFGSLPILGYFAAVFLRPIRSTSHWSKSPVWKSGLARSTLGIRQHVPRWIPRLTPWRDTFQPPD